MLFKKKVLHWAIVFLLAFLLLDVSHFFRAPLLPKGSQPVIFRLEPGTSFWRVAYALHDQQLLSRPAYWSAMVFLGGYSRDLKAGDYQIVPGEKPWELLQQIVQGKIHLYSITVPEGWTFSQMTDLLGQHPYVEHTLEAYSPAMIMQKLGKEGVGDPEGYFFPSTYLFARGTPDIIILKVAHETMRQKLEREWANRDPNVPYKDKDEALIVASLVEKEAARHEERPIIAGAILNRLHKKMLLQVDASVIYGLKGRLHGKLTKEDLKIDTPYNTYLHKGLPPTPICLPGDDSLHAAMHPVKSNILFWVARGDGTHQFSLTLKQHMQAVDQYIKNKHNDE
ncbi:MAG: endolytic transglycosylase MltG [Gammaproteobacteria bacterium]|nr:endolytic transglycosylase MltG [Gammaproteobacteria bacterium]